MVNRTTRPIKAETMRADGTIVADAECWLSNDRGVITMRSGDTAQVCCSGANLDIVCKDPTNLCRDIPRPAMSDERCSATRPGK